MKDWTQAYINRLVLIMTFKCRPKAIACFVLGNNKLNKTYDLILRN